MSATDELRAELTKRGVEWKAPSSYDGSNRYDTVAGGYWFHEFDGKITIHGLTPEQAIAATLGAGTCRFKTVIDNDPSRRHRGNICECDGCGYRCARGFIEDERFKYCPNCGRRIEGVTS